MMRHRRDVPDLLSLIGQSVTSIRAVTSSQSQPTMRRDLALPWAVQFTGQTAKRLRTLLAEYPEELAQVHKSDCVQLKRLTIGIEEESWNAPSSMGWNWNTRFEGQASRCC